MGGRDGGRKGGRRGGVYFQQLIDKCSAPPVFVDEDGNKTSGRLVG